MCLSARTGPKFKRVLGISHVKWWERLSVWILSRPPRLTTDLTLRRLSPYPALYLYLYSTNIYIPATKGAVPFSSCLAQGHRAKHDSEVISRHSRAQWGSRNCNCKRRLSFYACGIVVLALSTSVDPRGESDHYFTSPVSSSSPSAMACQHASLGRHDAAQEIHCAGHAASNRLVVQIHVTTSYRARELRVFLVCTQLHAPRQSRLAAPID
jgi:hypothetical protein